MNPFFGVMGGGGRPNMMQQFQQFMQQMKGKDPNAIINEMVSSGKISQEQLNHVQQQAQQMSGMFDGDGECSASDQNPGRVLKIKTKENLHESFLLTAAPL